MPLAGLGWRWAALGSFGGVMVCSVPARGASLSWEAPASCPAVAEVVERIEATLGRPLAQAPPVAFAAQVGEDPGGRFTLTVRTRASDEEENAAQTRTLTARRCDELVTALAQVVSLALGPHVPKSTEPEDRSERPEPLDASEAGNASNEQPALARAEPPRRWPVPARPTATSPTARIGVLAVVDTASLGTTSQGVHLETGWSLSAGLELRGLMGYVPPHGVDAEADDANAGGRFALLFGGLLACTPLLETSWRVPICVGVEAGRWNASGTGVSEPETDDVLWVAARADVRLGVEVVPGLRASVLGGLVAPLIRHEFSVAGASVHRMPALAPRAGLGLEYAFERRQ